MTARKLAIVVLGLGLSCSAPRSGTERTPSPWPATPAAATARAFIAAYNSGEAETLREFESTHRVASALESQSADERAAYWIDRYRHWGAIDVLQVSGDATERISVLVHTATSDSRLELVFDLEPQPPHRLIAIRIGAAVPPPPVPPPKGLKR